MTPALWSTNVTPLLPILPWLLLPSIPYIAYILMRVASRKALLSMDPLPHQKCYPNRLSWGQESEETEHVGSMRTA